MTDNDNKENPRVFISYSWDSPEHKLWVESFAQELRKAGIDARLDAWRDESQSIDDFMMIELERAKYVIAICTPQFKQKIVENAEGASGTASGFEMGTAAALRRVGGKDVIPVLKAGDWLESAPSSLVSYRYYDFTKDDISEEFAQLRDRLLGHVRRPPKLGHPTGPADAPDLPDIFAGGSKPKAETSAAASAAPPAQAPAGHGAPSATQAAPVAAPASKGRRKTWIWVGAAVLAVVLIWALMPGEEPYDDSSIAGIQDSPDAPTEEVAGSVDAEPEAHWADSGETEDLGVTEPADYEPSADPTEGWLQEYDDTRCAVYVQRPAGSWLIMGYNFAHESYYLQSYDPAWNWTEVGKVYYLVLEFDEDSELAYWEEGKGIFDPQDQSQGVEFAFKDSEILDVLSQRHLLSIYQDEPPYTDFLVVDHELRGSGIALDNLYACMRNLAG